MGHSDDSEGGEESRTDKAEKRLLVLRAREPTAGISVCDPDLQEWGACSSAGVRIRCAASGGREKTNFRFERGKDRAMGPQTVESDLHG